MTAQFATTKNMFSAYLNQDYDLMFGTADDALRAFVAHSSRDEVDRVQYEICTIQAMNLSEPDLEALVMRNLGCCYQYLLEWPSGDAWLNHVRTLLRV